MQADRQKTFFIFEDTVLWQFHCCRCTHLNILAQRHCWNYKDCHTGAYIWVLDPNLKYSKYCHLVLEIMNFAHSSKTCSLQECNRLMGFFFFFSNTEFMLRIDIYFWSYESKIHKKSLNLTKNKDINRIASQLNWTQFYKVNDFTCQWSHKENKSDGNICIIYRQIHNIHIDDFLDPNKTHVGLLVKRKENKKKQNRRIQSQCWSFRVYHLFNVKLVMTKTVQFLLENISINII